MRVIEGCTLAVFAVIAVSCGYVGDPLPPSLHIPEPVAALTAAQTGDEIEIAFVPPILTTDGLKIREPGKTELRIGPVRDSVEAWLETSEAIPVPMLPVESGTEVRVNLPAKRWEGQEVAVGVRTFGRSGRPSAWSELRNLQVSRILPTPETVLAELNASGVRLRWPGVPAAVSYRIVRQEGIAKEPPDLNAAGTEVQKPEYTDTGIAPGTTYTYFVQARNGDRASPWSEPVAIKVEDAFPPPAPTGLTVVPALESIELSWEAVASADLAGYRVYRSQADGDWAVIADSVPVPAYSDRSVADGGSYRYAVTAVDRSGNESARSGTATAQAP